MTAKLILKILGTFAVASMLAQPAVCAELTPYIKATPQGQPKSEIGANFAYEAIDLRGAVVTKRAGAETLVMPQLVSSFLLIPDVSIQTRATFANWNEGVASNGDTIETKLTAHSILPMFAEIEGLVGRDVAGESYRTLRFKMHETALPTFWFEPITLKANASFERIDLGKASTLLTGVEAALVQKSASDRVYNRIGFKYTAETGATEYQRQAATFTRSWLQNDLLRLGVEYELTHEAASLQNAVRFTWQGYF
jgi:hypothetical protein